MVFHASFITLISTAWRPKKLTTHCSTNSLQILPRAQRSPTSAFAIAIPRFSGTAVDATCRLNNRDWAAGQRVLAEVASAWDPGDEPLRTGRQFALLVPADGNADEITPPSFWDRLRGRA